MWRQILVLIAFILMAIVNIFSTQAPFWIFPLSNSDISDRYPTSIAPAGFTFSVWSVIYILILSYVIYQLLPSNHSNLFLQKLAFWQILNFIFNGLWLLVFANEQYWLGVFVIGANLYVLYRAYRLLGVGKRKTSWPEKCFVHLAVSTNLSWVLVANLANFTLVLKANGFTAQSDWAVAWVIFATCVAAFVAVTRADLAYGAVFVWACAGIAANHTDDITLYPITIVCACLAALLFVVSAVIQFFYGRYDAQDIRMSGFLDLKALGFFDDYRDVMRAQHETQAMKEAPVAYA